MLRITTVDEAYADVDATLITLDGETLACWADLAVEPVARYRVGQVRTVQALEQYGQPGASARPRATSEFPNAFRRWTEADENAVIEAYHRGETFEQIAAAVGRRVGGVRARLIAMNVIEPEPGDRLSYPGFHSPALAAAGPGRGGDGARPRLSVVRSGDDRVRPARRAPDARREGDGGPAVPPSGEAGVAPDGTGSASRGDVAASSGAASSMPRGESPTGGSGSTAIAPGAGSPEARAGSPGATRPSRHPASLPESGGPGEPPQTPVTLP